MKQMLVKAAVVAGIVATSLGVAATGAGADTIGADGGCTPGYWKNHHAAWEEYGPDLQLQWMLAANNTAYAFPAGLESFGTATMDEALRFGGGPGVEGAAQILLRAATASFLNAAHEGVEFPLRRFTTGLNGEPALRDQVRAALDSGDRDTMLALAAELDGYNNGVCELGGPNSNAGGRGRP